MKTKWAKYYLFIGTIIAFVLVAVSSFVFVRNNINLLNDKYNFESIYVNTDVDFIIPSPTVAQVQDLESTNVGIEAVTPFYETSTRILINGHESMGTTLIFPYENKMDFTPYVNKRIVDGITAKENEAVVDQKYANNNGCSIGDKVDFSISDRIFSFEIVGISENNTYCKDGSIALVLGSDEKSYFEEAGVHYSAAYVKSSDIVTCKKYLLNEYKPYGRLKDSSEFNSEESYKQHLQNFLDADWSTEVTDCHSNYDSLKIKYDGIASSINKNLIIDAVIIFMFVLIPNFVYLGNSNIQKIVKQYLVKKGGKVSTIRTFYVSGIWFDFILFLLISVVAYYFITFNTNIGLLGQQIVNVIIPVFVALITSVLSTIIAYAVVKVKYSSKQG